jgi:hypothetical protein
MNSLKEAKPAFRATWDAEGKSALGESGPKMLGANISADYPKRK